jgi:hypothetical protein
MFELTFFFSNCLTFLFNKTVLQYRDIIIKITLFILSLLISIYWIILFLKCKQIMLFDKANIQFTASNGAFGVIAMWSVGCPFRSSWFANMVSSFAFVVINGPSLIKIISARNQDIIMVYEAVINVDIYGVGLANTRVQL